MMLMAFNAQADITTEIDLSLGKDYELGSTEVDLVSQTYTVNYTYDIDDLSITGKLGVWNASSEVLGVDVDTQVGLVLGVEVEQKLIDLNPDMYVSAIGSYTYKDSEINEINGFDMPIRNDVNLHEWEVGLKMYVDILPTPIDLVPYVAMVISDSKLNITSLGEELNLEADENIGFRGGLESKINEDWSAKLEVRAIDDRAIVLSGRYKF